MASHALMYIAMILVASVATVEGNMEGDALSVWRTKLMDPNNVLQSWDPTLVNPCTWFHITCNSVNSVIRVELGNANLTGTLVPQLGSLSNLQYLYVNGNGISGSIPSEIGNLKNLVGLNLQNNLLSGAVPPSLGNLKSLMFMRLNNNHLTGTIPAEVIQLILNGNLRLLNVANNSMAGTAQPTKTKGYVITRVIQDPRTQ